MELTVQLSPWLYGMSCRNARKKMHIGNLIGFSSDFSSNLHVVNSNFSIRVQYSTCVDFFFLQMLSVNQCAYQMD